MQDKARNIFRRSICGNGKTLLSKFYRPIRGIMCGVVNVPFSCYQALTRNPVCSCRLSRYFLVGLSDLQNDSAWTSAIFALKAPTRTLELRSDVNA